MEINGSQVLTAALAGAIALLFIALSVLFLGRGILLKMRAKSASIFAGRPAEFVLIIHGIALVILISLIYSAVIEPAQLTTTKYTVVSDKIKKPLKLAVISDLKWPRCRVSINKLVDQVNRIEPDMVLFCGDMVVSEDFIKAADELSKLNCSRRFGCLGNALPMGDVDFYQLAGIQLLSSRGLRVIIGDQMVYVFGAEFGTEFADVQKPDVDDLSIFLTHSPELIPIVTTLNYDLYCCGHTLGGQIRLPFLRDLFIPGEFGRIYPRGLFEVGQMSAVVSSGVGMSKTAPKIRLFCEPEVLKVELTPKNPAAE